MLPKKSEHESGGINVMVTKAGVGMSHHRNPMMAGRKAARIYLECCVFYMVKGVPE